MIDYIKRDAIQKALIDLPVDLDAKTVQRCIEAVHNFPAADVVEVRHARWIGVRLGDMRCSLCGEVYGVCGGLLGDYNYCPNCGAKMDGRGEG